MLQIELITDNNSIEEIEKKDLVNNSKPEENIKAECDPGTCQPDFHCNPWDMCNPNCTCHPDS